MSYYLLILLQQFWYIYAFFSLTSFVPRFHSEKRIILVNLNIHPFTVIGIEWLYKGLEKYQYITIRTIIFKLVSLFLVLYS